MQNQRELTILRGRFRHQCLKLVYLLLIEDYLKWPVLKFVSRPIQTSKMGKGKLLSFSSFAVILHNSAASVARLSFNSGTNGGDPNSVFFDKSG